MFVQNLKLKNMEALIVLILLTILAVPIILMVVFKVSISGQIKEAILKIHSLNVKVDQLREDVISPKVVSEEDSSAYDERVETLLNKAEQRVEEIQKTEIEQVEKKPDEETPKVEEIAPKPKLVKPIAPKVEQLKSVQKAAFVKPPKKKRDIEKFVGENLLNKIGIGVLVLGIAYFVKYAIDNNWIGEVGRVAIGILSGGLLTFLA